MQRSWRVSYMGKGVATNKLGTFQQYTTAFTEDGQLARQLAESDLWLVYDPDGVPVGQTQLPFAVETKKPVVSPVIENVEWMDETEDK